MYVQSVVHALPRNDSINIIGVPPVIIHGKEYHIYGNSDEKSKNTKTKDDVENKSTKGKHKTQGLLEVACSLELCDEPHQNQTVKAFIDTGAQVTVISLEAAKRCGLKEHIDFKYAGKAVGVAGSTRIVGRLRDITLVLVSDDGQCVRVVCKSAVVIKEAFSLPGLDLLIGLDLLSELNALINLSDNTITFEINDENSRFTSRIPFLGRENKMDQDLDVEGRHAISHDDLSDQEQLAFGMSQHKKKDLHLRENYFESDSNSDYDDNGEAIDFAGL